MAPHELHHSCLAFRKPHYRFRNLLMERSFQCASRCKLILRLADLTGNKHPFVGPFRSFSLRSLQLVPLPTLPFCTRAYCSGIRSWVHQASPFSLFVSWIETERPLAFFRPRPDLWDATKVLVRLVKALLSWCRAGLGREGRMWERLMMCICYFIARASDK